MTTTIKKQNTNTAVRPGYKHTPLGWIPEEWEVESLGKLGEFKNGINKGKEEFGHGYPLVNIMDVFGVIKVYNGQFSLVNSTEKERKEYSLKKGDVLFIRSSVKPEGVGLTSLICEDINEAVYSGFIIRFRSSSEIDFNFKTQCFYEKGFRQRLLNKSTISANTNINQVALKSLTIPLPPLPEQRKIAAILSTWDDAIQTTQALIARLQLRNKGLAQQLLTGKKRLKGFEGEWVKLHSDKIFKSVSKKNNDDEELLSVTQDRGAIPRTMLEGRVTMPDGSTKGYKLVEQGDFIISLRSFQGGLEYSEYRGLVSPAYTVLKPIKKISDSFYKYYFKSYDFIGHLAVAVIGIRDGKQISFDDFCTLRLPYPEVKEQVAIAAVLDKADEELKAQQAYLATLQQQKKGLMQQLLTGAVRVKTEKE
ncbi:MAG TPA: restriction endonuclease subunit S [Flavipsychrobacter sp.]